MSEAKPPKTPKLPKAPIKRDPKRGGGGAPGSPQPQNWKGIVFFMAACGLLFLGFWQYQLATEGATREIPFPEFKRYLEDNRIQTVDLYTEPAAGVSFLKGKFTDPLPKTERLPEAAGFRADVNLAFQKDLPDILAAHGFEAVPQKYVDNQFLQLFLGTLPFILFILLMYFLFRQQIKAAGRGAFSFGKSKAKIMNKEKNKITFKDVAGVEEAKEEVQEIVEFLRSPKKFQRLGGQIPKGVLMVGPPGTGKTLLAKAIAGEADVPFYGISGSDFVEMFVGVGASRVRDMFEQGRKNAPCLIFIDEIDAVGRSRGHGLGGGHDEREQTLNALLVEMDGIDTQEGVIIIAATNRKDVLDPALLRPGRFDREVGVSLPDVKGREQILQVHAAKVKYADTVEWSRIARGTPGFSGAELANLINEAALIAARRDAEAIEQHDLEEARDKVRYGRERRSLAMSDEQKKITAYHEAGHAILNVVLEHTDPLHKVTIIPRGPALGSTMMLPDEDRYGYGQKKLRDELCVIMGGRIAEDLFIGDISSGAAGDIKMATHYAKKMVCEWGMSEKLGMVEYGDHDDYIFLGREMGKSRGYSEDTAKVIDQEIQRIIQDAYDKAYQMLSERREILDKLAQALLEYETLDAVHVEEIIDKGDMSNPPKKNVSAPVTPKPDEALDGLPEKGDGKKKDDDTLPGLEGAPAGA
jgi:cell division protease FtsH